MTAADTTTLDDSLRAALAVVSGASLALIFGSAAQGTARADSDIDIAVDYGRELCAEEKIALVQALAAATGRPVDLVDLRHTGEPLLGQILRHGRRLLGTDQVYGDWVTRHVFDSTDFLPYRNRILAERRLAWIGK